MTRKRKMSLHDCASVQECAKHILYSMYDICGKIYMDKFFFSALGHILNRIQIRIEWMKEKKKLTEHELLFGICFFAGIVWITLLARGKTPENTLLNQSLSASFLEKGWNRPALFWQCLYSRGMIMLLMIFLAYTPLWKLTFRMITAWIGLSFGMLFKLFFCWYGVSGIGLLLVSILPHFLFYWMAYGLLYWEMDRRRLRIVKSPFGIFIAIGVVIMGIVIESYVNPFLLRTYLKLFF